MAAVQRTQVTLPAQTGMLSDQPEDLVQMTLTDPQIYHRCQIFKVPTHMVGEHQLVTTSTACTMFSTLDGEENPCFQVAMREAAGKQPMPL